MFPIRARGKDRGKALSAIGEWNANRAELTTFPGASGMSERTHSFGGKRAFAFIESEQNTHPQKGLADFLVGR